MSYIFNKNNYRECHLIGGKAKGLGLLSENNINVPEWLVISPSAFYDSLCERKDTITADDIEHTILKPGIISSIQNSVEKLAKDCKYFAVRSSAIDEDGTTKSFAGQYESYLYIEKENILQYVKKVWHSAIENRVKIYNETLTGTSQLYIPAVIIQRMIDASSAGVIFTCDPVTGNSDYSVINSNIGIGTSVVTGETDTDIFHVSKDLKCIHRNIQEKSHFDHFDFSQNKFVSKNIINNKASISEETILKLAETAFNIEKLFGKPQDIEWCQSENGTIHILQSRAVTTLPRNNESEIIWDNSNIVESYNGMTSPLTFSFIKNAYAKVYETTCNILGVKKSLIDENRAVFESMIGYIDGRVYYNLINWYTLISLFPGFNKNKAYMEQMMGVKKQLPDKIVERFQEKKGFKGIKEKFGALGTYSGILWNFVTFDKNEKKFYATVNAVLKEKKELTNLSYIELIEFYRELELKLLQNWGIPIVNDFFAMIFFGILGDLLKKYNLNDDGIRNIIVAGGEGIISAEPVKLISKLGQLASQNPTLLKSLKKNNLSEISKYEEFSKLYSEYIESYGDRSVEELKLESETLIDNPTLLINSIISFAENPKKYISTSNRGKSAEQEVLEKLNRNLIKKCTFRIILHFAKKHIKSRENLRYERTKVFAVVRRIIRQLGEKLAADKIINNPKDIFFLEIEEAFGLINGRSVNKNIKNLIEIRKQEFEENKKIILPERFSTKGVLIEKNRIEDIKEDLLQNENLKKGIGASSGLITGKVQIVLDPRNAIIEKGAIIVAKSTDPGWVMIFPLASAIIVEKGSLLSHSAIVAREMGIPAVVSLTGVTTWLKNGDIVKINGNTGTIERLEQNRSD